MGLSMRTNGKLWTRCHMALERSCIMIVSITSSAPVGLHSDKCAKVLAIWRTFQSTKGARGPSIGKEGNAQISHHKQHKCRLPSHFKDDDALIFRCDCVL